MFITGDFNGRTSNFSDILDFDRYIENQDLFLEMSHIPIRVNKDTIFDSHDRKLLELCKSTSFIIANGRLGEDYNVGEITYCSLQGMSTVAYLLLHSTNLKFIKDFQVLPVNEYSHHAPLLFSLSVEYQVSE